MLVPAKTPRPIIGRLNAETTKALALPEVQQKLPPKASNLHRSPRARSMP